MNTQTSSTDTTENDKAALVSIVKEMAESMTGAQSTKHWAEDALWFDIPAFASKGVKPALKFFDKVFSGFQTCNVDILETETVVTGKMGIVCTVQRVNVVLKTGATKSMLVRETDCFEKRHSSWQLIHQTPLSPPEESGTGRSPRRRSSHEPHHRPRGR